MANFGYIQLTRLCNQECRICSNPPNNNILTYEEGVKLIDDYIRLDYKGVILTGGEPTIADSLPDLIKYCAEKNFLCRIITNGQKIADINYLRKLKDCGLCHLGLSMYSYKNDIQSFLSKNEYSLRNVLKSLENIGELGGFTVDMTTAINKYNAGHLSKNVKFIIQRFPFVRHFVWNNLDPMFNRATIYTDTIPRLIDFELELYKAANILEKTDRTYRIERVPLCYMDGFEYTSTETRKIVMGEERSVYFLDQKGLIRQQTFEYGKAECCKICALNEICAGLYAMDIFYSSSELYPVFVDKEKVVKKIRESRTVQ